ncbi:MAG: hypothetical protein U1E89_04270 [Burkholderiaceae bacterium]
MLRISLGDGTDAFARVLPNSQVAAYAHRVSQADAPSADVFGSKILWKLTVMKSALTSGRWPVVDFRPLEPELASPVEYFIKDRLTGRYSIYRSSDGHARESTFEECKVLEAAAAWEAEQVEDRLRDYFAGRPNVWTEQLKASP